MKIVYRQASDLSEEETQRKLDRAFNILFNEVVKHKTMKCKKCGQEMHQIPNVADVKPEGAPSSKYDGINRYQCINEECEDYEKIVEVRAGE